MSKYIDAVGQAYQEIQEKLMTSAERAKEMQKQADAAKKKAVGQAAKAGQKVEDNTNDKSDDGDGLDKVQPKAVKKKFKDRKDKDIDNDGDVDSSDKYLHKRRKAISKKSKDKEGDVEMNPKLDKESTQKESRIRSALKAVLAEKKDAHYKGATKPEEMQDKLSGKGAKDMVNQPVDLNDTEEKGHDDATKAGRVTKPASARNSGDAVRSGEQKIKKSATSVAEAYASMYEDWTAEDIGEDVDKAVSTLRKKTRDGNWANKNGKVAHSYLGHKEVRKKLDKHGMNNVPHHVATSKTGAP